MCDGDGDGCRAACGAGGERRGEGHRGAAVLHRLVGLDRGSGLGAVAAVLLPVAAPPKQFNTAFYSNPQVDRI